MPHSFDELNCATNDSSSAASVPNHGCHNVTLTPLSDSTSTPNPLTGSAVEAGVIATSLASVRAVGGLAVSEAGTQAERRKMKDER